MTHDALILPSSSPPTILVDEIVTSGEGHVMIPVASGIAIKPGRTARISVRPRTIAFRPDRIVIGDAASWTIREVLIGERPQLSLPGEIAGVPGEAFVSSVGDGTIRFHTVQTAMDFSLIVAYVGGDPAGAPFFAVAMGIAAL